MGAASDGPSQAPGHHAELWCSQKYRDLAKKVILHQEKTLQDIFVTNTVSSGAFVIARVHLLLKRVWHGAKSLFSLWHVVSDVDVSDADYFSK